MNGTDTNWTVVTGSTGGIGRELTKILAARGNALILVNRSEIKSKAQYDELSRNYPNLTVELVQADLMDTDQVAQALATINELSGRIDALYNNSGILTAKKVLSPQGVESQFAVNTLASYLLIQGLRAKMARPKSEEPAMIVNFSSSAITPLKTLDLNNLKNPETVGGLMSTYAQTKLAVTALAPALADTLKDQNILIRAIDPGATKSAMTTTGNSAMPKPLAWLAPLLFKPADKQAQKIVDGADPAAFGGCTGIYVANRKEKKMPASVTDHKVQHDLIALLDGI